MKRIGSARSWAGLLMCGVLAAHAWARPPAKLMEAPALQANPNAAPIMPNALARFSGAVTSAM